MGPDDFISIRGINNETLLITAAQKSHSGAYQCFATRKAQTAQDFAIIVLEGELGSLRWRCWVLEVEVLCACLCACVCASGVEV